MKMLVNTLKRLFKTLFLKKLLQKRLSMWKICMHFLPFGNIMLM